MLAGLIGIHSKVVLLGDSYYLIGSLSLHAVSTGILEQGRRFAHAFAEYCLYTFGIEEVKTWS